MVIIDWKVLNSQKVHIVKYWMSKAGFIRIIYHQLYKKMFLILDLQKTHVCNLKNTPKFT